MQAVVFSQFWMHVEVVARCLAGEAIRAAVVTEHLKPAARFQALAAFARDPALGAPPRPAPSLPGWSGAFSRAPPLLLGHRSDSHLPSFRPPRSHSRMPSRAAKQARQGWRLPAGLVNSREQSEAPQCGPPAAATCAVPPRAGSLLRCEGTAPPNNAPSPGRAEVLVMDRAGSVGLDLSFAAAVFLMEPLADPALEQQVVSRAHRMGATQPIAVETLVMQVKHLSRKYHLPELARRVTDLRSCFAGMPLVSRVQSQLPGLNWICQRNDWICHMSLQSE